MLIVFRVLQGAGGGGLQPSEQSILADTFPPDKLGMVFALYGVAVVVAPAVGPTLGGWITDNYSWHWVFLINVPVGLVSLSLTYALLATPSAEERRRWDILRRGLRINYIGFGLVAIGLGCLQVVLDKGQREDWFASTFIISFTVIAAVALLMLIVRELTHEDPIVDLPLLKDRNFLAANLIMFALGFILFGTTQLLPQLVEAVEADRRAVAMANDLYRNGLSTFLNVLDSERALFSSQSDLAQSKATVSTDVVALYKALGGGWESLASAP